MVGIRKGRWPLGLTVVVALLAAACGSKAAPASSGGGGTGGNTNKSGQVQARSIAGIGTVLSSPSGLTLYRLKTEANGKIECTGGCASTWPPLLAASGKVPAASADVAGHLGTIDRPDGSLQVTFDGMPLYTYSGDSGPGQAKGQGIGGVWFAVSTSGASPSAQGSGY
jgi:predicted lipoprotein with Yx(FWY)xxD motif